MYLVITKCKLCLLFVYMIENSRSYILWLEYWKILAAFKLFNTHNVTEKEKRRILSSFHWIFKFYLSFVRKCWKRRKWYWQRDKNQLSSGRAISKKIVFGVSYFSWLSNWSLSSRLCQSWCDETIYVSFSCYK